MEKGIEFFCRIAGIVRDGTIVIHFNDPIQKDEKEVGGVYLRIIASSKEEARKMMSPKKGDIWDFVSL